MNGKEFIRHARKYARRNNLDFRLIPSHGKGSHGSVRVGNKKTTVKHGEIGKGLFLKMLNDLGIDKEDF